MAGQFRLGGSLFEASDTGVEVSDLLVDDFAMRGHTVTYGFEDFPLGISNHSANLFVDNPLGINSNTSYNVRFQ